jgi:phosphatidylethanolamine-binding protein (PEBP) family uncharacterized protein
VRTEEDAAVRRRFAKADLERAMKPHILAQAELMGKYGR